MNRALLIALITVAILVVGASIAIPVAIIASKKDSKHSETAPDLTTPASTSPLPSDTPTVTQSRTPGPPSHTTIDQFPVQTTATQSTQAAASSDPTSTTSTPPTTTPLIIATTSTAPVVSTMVASIPILTTTIPVSTSTSATATTTPAPTTTPSPTTTSAEPTTTSADTTTPSSTTTTPAPVATHPASTVPSWANGALVADVTWSDVYDDTLSAEVTTALTAVQNQNVTVAEADISLSFNLNDTAFASLLDVASTSATAGAALGMKQVWYYPSLEIITDHALVNDVLQSYAFSLQHPDWLQRSLVNNATNSFSDPNVVFWVTAGQESAWVSPNSPWRDIFISRIKQLVGVGINGIWPDVPIYFDGVVQWCDQSVWDRTQFALDTNGMAFPTGVDWYSSSQSGISFRRWVVWRHENIAKFLREVADGCSAQSSDCLIVVEVVTMDYHDASNLGLDGAYLKDIPNLMIVWEVDVMSEDSGVRYALENDWVRLISMYKYGRAASGNKPSWAFSYGLCEDDAQSVMAEVLIAGNSPYEVKTPNKEKGVDQGVTGSTFRKRWYSWAKQYSDLIFQTPRRSLAKVLVYHSSSSRDFVYPEPYGSGLMCNAVKPAGASVWWSTDSAANCLNQRYIGEYTGMVKALQQKQIPFDLMTSPGILASDLMSYDVIMAPLLTAVSDSEVQIFRDWVNAGGLLILTGSNPFGADEYGTNRTNLALADVLGFDRDAIPVSSVDHAHGNGHVYFYADLLGLSYLTSSNNLTSLAALVDPITQYKPQKLRVPSAHRCVHFEANQPATGSSYVLQFSNYVGVCETAIGTRQETNGTWPVPLYPQTLNVEVDLDISSQIVSSVMETEPNTVPPQMNTVTGWAMDGSTLKFQIVVSVYKLIQISFST